MTRQRRRGPGQRAGPSAGRAGSFTAVLTWRGGEGAPVGAKQGLWSPSKRP